MIFNDFGTWENLGNVDVSIDWQILPFFASTPNSTFWVAYVINKPEFVDILPPIYLRGLYFTGSVYLADQNWKRLFAKDEPEIIEYPYPADLITDPIIPRQIQLKFGRGKQAILNRHNLSVEVQVFEKISTSVVYPIGSVELQPTPTEEPAQ